MDLKEITCYATQIEKLHKDGNYEDVSLLLKDLSCANVTLEKLHKTAIVKSLYQLVKSCPVAAVRKTAKDLLSKWKQVYSSPYEHKSIKDKSNIKECEPDEDKTEISETVSSLTQHQCQKVNDIERVMCNILDPSAVNQELTGQKSGLNLASGQLSPEGTTSLKESGESTNTPKAEVKKAVVSDLPNFSGKEDSGTTFMVTPAPGTEGTNLRAKCVELLLQALTSDQEAHAKSTTQLSALAHAIEKHIHALHSQNQLKYKSCVRCKIANLKNPKSPHLRHGLLTGALAPDAFARMTAEEMAGEELRRLREGFTAAGISERQLPRCPDGTRTTKLRCRRCETTECSVTQVSRGTLFLPSWVRSSSTDEDVMTFVTCAGCGEQWYHSRWVCL